MKYGKILFIVLVSIVFITTAGYSFETSFFGTYSYQQFQKYWFSGRGEISRFSLEQARYGEVHKEDAVLVYVTETMNPAKQVKADTPGPKDVPVLKPNAVRKFFTGMYPYSVMTSVFAPVDSQKYPLPLKISASTQEWCGLVYLQMNLRENEFHVTSHSYFEKEGDKQFRLQKILPEDALWTRLRIAPATLPQGEFLLIPSATYSRFLHRPLKPVRVVGRLNEIENKSLEGVSLVRYEVNFKEVQRTIMISFEKEFPYRIQQWEDTYPGLSRMAPKTLTTRAIRTHTTMIDYWNHHDNKDRGLLDRLGLGPRELAVR